MIDVFTQTDFYPKEHRICLGSLNGRTPTPEIYSQMYNEHPRIAAFARLDTKLKPVATAVEIAKAWVKELHSNSGKQKTLFMLSDAMQKLGTDGYGSGKSAISLCVYHACGRWSIVDDHLYWVNNGSRWFTPSTLWAEYQANPQVSDWLFGEQTGNEPSQQVVVIDDWSLHAFSRYLKQSGESDETLRIFAKDVIQVVLDHPYGGLIISANEHSDTFRKNIGGRAWSRLTAHTGAEIKLSGVKSFRGRG